MLRSQALMSQDRAHSVTVDVTPCDNTAAIGPTQAICLACVNIAAALWVFWFAYALAWLGVPGRERFSDPGIYLGAVSAKATLLSALLAALCGAVTYAVARPLAPSRNLWLAFSTTTTLLTLLAAFIGWTPAWAAICFLLGIMLVTEVGGRLSVWRGRPAPYTPAQHRLYKEPLSLALMASATAVMVFYNPVLKNYTMFRLMPVYILRHEYSWALPLYEALTIYVTPMLLAIVMVIALRLLTRTAIPLSTFAITLTILVSSLTYANAQRWFMREDLWSPLFAVTAVCTIGSLFMINRKNRR